MENFRSKSTREGRVQELESYSSNGYGGGGSNKTAAFPTSMHDLRSYSNPHNHVQPPPEFYMDQSKKEMKMMKIKKSKSNKVNASSAASSSLAKSWSLKDPELQRKKRVVGYKAYAVEGKMKGSLRKSFRWIKDTCNQVVYGWW